MLPPKPQGRRPGSLEKSKVKHQERDDRKTNYRQPGNNVEDRAIGVGPHQLFIVDQFQNNIKKDRQDQSIQGLGSGQDKNYREVGDKDQKGADKKTKSNDRIEQGGFPERRVNLPLRS
jgi:hypothetical protein